MCKKFNKETVYGEAKKTVAEHGGKGGEAWQAEQEYSCSNPDYILPADFLPEFSSAPRSL